MQDEEGPIRRAQQRDPVALTQLYEENFDRIYRYIVLKIGDRTEAEDMTQQVFLNALKSISSFRWKGTSFSAWLYRIAHQQIIQNHRRENRYVSLPPDQPAGADVEAQVQSRMQWRVILRAFQKLSISDQEVLALRLFDSLSNSETAEYLNCSPQNVSVRLYRALKHLRQKLEALGEYYGDMNHGT